MKRTMILVSVAALCLVACNKNARVTGVVMDPVTSTPVVGATVQATCAEKGKKTEARTNAAGKYSIGLPPGSWRLTVTPKTSTSGATEYIPCPMSLQVYEKDRVSADTWWLVPTPASPQQRTAWLMDRGHGYIVMYGSSDLGVDDEKGVGQSQRLPALVTHSPLYTAYLAAEKPMRLLSVSDVQWQPPSWPYPGWYRFNCRPVAATRSVSAGEWRVITWPKVLEPGRYVIGWRGWADSWWDMFSVEAPDSAGGAGLPLEDDEADPATREWLERKYPGSSIAYWNDWAVVREPVERGSGDAPAHLYLKEAGEWTLVTSSSEGLNSVGQVKEHIPNLTAEGRRELGLMQ